ncbi:MAG: hypothetical protein C4K49_10175 [Candidatus Thorarchaeota archaeon]|nr:MAG: hypothetical protein C4K49_10175 [Candidatus Thorarchaeota archaeon]
MKGFLLALTIISLAVPIALPLQVQAADTDSVLFDPVDIRAIMHENTSTSLMVDARANNVGSLSMSSLSIGIESLELEVIAVRVDNETANGETILRDDYTEITVTLPKVLEANSSVWLHLALVASDLQSPLVIAQDASHVSGDFLFYVRPLSVFANFTFTAVLPPYASLSNDYVVTLFPHSDSNFTDGQSLIFVWDVPLLQPGQERVFIIKYQLPNISTVQAQSSFLGSLLYGALGVIAGLALAFGGPRVIERLKRLGAVKYVGVTAEEEEVLATIREKGGSCTQKELYSLFDMSQSKMSLILTNLEQRGLIRRLKEGRENVVHLMEPKQAG